MSDGRKALKEKMAGMIHILAAGDVLARMKGHLSYRIPGTDEILILGHAHKDGKTLASITADDIVTIDLDGKLLEGSIQPPGEKYLHTCVYKARDDVQAVIHAHSTVSLAFGVAGIEIIPVHHEAIAFAPSVEILDYVGQIDSEERGKMVAEALKDRAALLLRGHGVVVVGGNLEEVCCNAFELEINASIQLTAMTLGTPRAVRKEEIQKAPQSGGKPHKSTSIWPYYVEKFGVPPKHQ